MFPFDQTLFEIVNKSSLMRTEHNSTEVNGNDFSPHKFSTQTSRFYEYTSIRRKQKAFIIFKYI